MIEIKWRNDKEKKKKKSSYAATERQDHSVRMRSEWDKWTQRWSSKWQKYRRRVADHYTFYMPYMRGMDTAQVCGARARERLWTQKLMATTEQNAKSRSSELTSSKIKNQFKYNLKCIISDKSPVCVCVCVGCMLAIATDRAHVCVCECEPCRALTESIKGHRFCTVFVVVIIIRRALFCGVLLSACLLLVVHSKSIFFYTHSDAFWTQRRNNAVVAVKLLKTQSAVCAWRVSSGGGGCRLPVFHTYSFIIHRFGRLWPFYASLHPISLCVRTYDLHQKNERREKKEKQFISFCLKFTSVFLLYRSSVHMLHLARSNFSLRFSLNRAYTANSVHFVIASPRIAKRLNHFVVFVSCAALRQFGWAAVCFP